MYVSILLDLWFQVTVFYLSAVQSDLFQTVTFNINEREISDKQETYE